MKLSNLVTSGFVVLALAVSAQAQWIKVPLAGTPRDKDGKPNLSAPAPRTSPNHMLPIPIKIVQTPGLILTLFEEFFVFRQIFTDGRKLPVDPQPSWFGYSVAHWEKDVLVVESSGFNDRTYLDGEGLPHSQDLRITERYRRPDFGHLVIDFTFTDPKYYERPWTATIPFDLMPDTELIEHFCENEKDQGALIRK
jgi:hypothetical protein